MPHAHLKYLVALCLVTALAIPACAQVESGDKPLAMIGRSMFEARRWISASTHAVNAELEAKLSVRLVA